jgi:phosphoserine aminotransferase
MISFYPGPSRVYDRIPLYVKEAHQAGILSMNHRSDDFMKLMKKTVTVLRQKLHVPADYTILFTSSATECWEVIAQSLISTNSIHLFNGAFGEKWFDYTKRIHPQSASITFNHEEELDPSLPGMEGYEVVAITQNETSNGTQVDTAIIDSIRLRHPDSVIAVDATSSMGGIYLDFTVADIWFASVQKCFGLPAGLAVMVLSPKTIERMAFIGESSHYNSLSLMVNMMGKFQTSFTPNVMGIYLLLRTLQDSPSVKATGKMVKKRFEAWEVFFRGSLVMPFFIENKAVRSQTVLTIKAGIHGEKIKRAATRQGFLIGEGYGALKKDTFRIANFPALSEKEILALRRLLAPYL